MTQRLYFGVNDPPSNATSIFGGDHLRDSSPYRLGPCEHAAWWTMGQLRDPQAEPPKPKPVDPPRPSTPAEPAADQYATLGDSYSAGEGLTPFRPGTDAAKNTRHRSKYKSYGQLVSPRPDRFVACSQQKTLAFTTRVMSGTERPQQGALDARSALVTITLGGNDLEWSNVLTEVADLFCTFEQLVQLLFGTWTTGTKPSRGHTTSCGDTKRPTPWIDAIELSPSAALHLVET